MKTGFVVVGILLTLFLVGTFGTKMAVDMPTPSTAPIEVVAKSTFQNTDQPGPSNLAEYTPANPAWRTGQKKHQYVPATAIHFEARHRK